MALHRSTSAIVALTFALAGQAQAQDVCPAYVGQTVTPTTIDAAIATVSKVPGVKGEFETTAQFEARQAAASGGTLGRMIVAKAPERKYFEYDADGGKLRIKSYAFDNINVDYDDVFGYGTKYYEKVKYSHLSYNLDVVMSETEVPTGSYVGGNAFGAKTRVTKKTRTTKVIFDHDAASYSEGLFPGADKNAVIGELALSPAEAQRLKATMRVAFAITPKAPYFASGVKNWGDATIDNPEEVRQPISVVIADIQCGLLLDAGGKVLAAYPTR